MTLFTKYKCPGCGKKADLQICRYCNEERCRECLPKHEQKHGRQKEPPETGQKEKKGCD